MYSIIIDVFTTNIYNTQGIHLKTNVTIFTTREECRNDIGRESMDNNNAPLLIVTRNIYSKSRNVYSNS